MALKLSELRLNDLQETFEIAGLRMDIRHPTGQELQAIEIQAIEETEKRGLPAHRLFGYNRLVHDELLAVAMVRKIHDLIDDENGDKPVETTPEIIKELLNKFGELRIRIATLSGNRMAFIEQRRERLAKNSGNTSGA